MCLHYLLRTVSNRYFAYVQIVPYKKLHYFKDCLLDLFSDSDCSLYNKLHGRKFEIQILFSVLQKLYRTQFCTVATTRL